MNKVMQSGRLTGDPKITYTTGVNPLCVARYTLAVNRKNPRDGEPTADFFNCVCFGKLAEHVERYYRKGIKIEICGELRNGSYTNRDGVKVNYTEIVVEESEFAESKRASEGSVGSNGSNNNNRPAPSSNLNGSGFMNIPDGIDEELPFVN